MKYEILYFDRHTEIVDKETMEQIVDELEMFERTDVCQIHRIYNNGKLGKTIWTEEEGLMVRG
jgi:ABC-type arginine transport system ATPase subunit